MKDPVIIYHRRFTIRRYTMNDAPALVKYFGHPAVIRGVRGHPWDYRQSDAKKFLRSRLRYYTAQSKQPGYAIAIHGRFAGGVGVNVDGHKGEIGYWLARPFWGQGLMSAVVKEWTKYVFKKHKLQRVEAKVFPFNRASARVLQKNGFRFEGRLVKSHKAGKKYLDDMIFAKIQK